MTRPTKAEWAFLVAQAVATRGECVRRQVGAVVIDRRGRIAGAGYNGSKPGGPNCLKGECPRGRHYRWTEAETSPGSEVFEFICRCEKPWPCEDAVEPGSSYDTGPGTCHAVHAEMNAILDVSDRLRLQNATLYVTTKPCDGCLKILGSTELAIVTWPDGWIEL